MTRILIAKEHPERRDTMMKSIGKNYSKTKAWPLSWVCERIFLLRQSRFFLGATVALCIVMILVTRTDLVYNFPYKRTFPKYHPTTGTPYMETFDGRAGTRIHKIVRDSMVLGGQFAKQFNDCSLIVGRTEGNGYADNNTIYITVDEGANGRLGNRMFQYASLFGIALEARERGLCVIPVIRKSSRILSFLHIFRLSLITNIEPLNNSIQVFEEKAMTHSSLILDRIKPGNNYTIGIYLQSWKYFIKFSNHIRKEFQFSQQILETASTFLLNNITQFHDEVILVGVHVRRGDMTLTGAVNRGYQPANKGHLLQAFKYFRELFPKVIFVVCSDDIVWATNNLKNNDVIFSDGNSPEVDLAILSMCNHVIMTSGSFGWWAAWLANGITIYYKNFPAPGSWLDSRCNKSHYYLPGWIGMAN